MAKRANPLINSDFAFLWAAQGISFLGDYIFDTTLVVWIAAVIARGQSWAPLAVSGVFVAISVPTLVIAPLAGVLVDRSDKRRMMMAMDLLRAILIAVLLGSTGIIGGFHPTTQIQLGSIYVVVFLATACAQFFGPARFALLGDLVPEASRSQATSMSQVTASVSAIIGPPLAVPVLFVLGIQWALIANAFSFIFSLILVSLVHAPVAARSSDSGDKPDFLGELRKGFQFTFTNPLVRTMLISVFIVTLGVGALNALDVFFMIKNLNTAANLYGFLVSGLGLGVLVGAIVSGSVAPRLGLRRVFWGSLIALGILLLIYARMTTFVGAVIVLFFAGFPEAAVNVAVAPLLLAAVPRALIGRVISLVGPITAIAGVLSAAGAAYLATSVLVGFHEHVGVVRLGTYDTIFSLAGLLVLTGGLYAMVSLRRADVLSREAPASHP